MNKLWEPILKRALKGEIGIPSPFASNGIIESLFIVVVVEGDKKMGFGLLWCSVTLKAIRLSRMEIPSYLPSVTVTEFENMKMPNLKIDW